MSAVLVYKRTHGRVKAVVYQDGFFKPKRDEQKDEDMTKVVKTIELNDAEAQLGVDELCRRYPL